MKKLLALTLCLMLLLCACGTPGNGDNTEGGSEPEENSSFVEEGSGENDTGENNTGENDKKKQAESCIGKSVQELYALIGEPNSAEYVESCLGDGEDGNLFYDGFIVYTYREGDMERVDFVE